MSLPDHEDRAPEYTWDTDQIYETPADWDAARDELSAEVDTDDPPGEPIEGTAAARELVDTVADWYRRKQRLALYATLRDSVSDAEAASDRQRAYRNLEAKVETVVAARIEAIRSADEATLNCIETALDDRTRYFASLRRQARHRRKPAVEAVIERFAEHRSSADRVVRAVTNEDLDPPVVEGPDGEERTITRGRYAREQSRPDRAYRQRVYEHYLDELAGFEGTLATAYGEKLAAASALADVRGFDSIRELQLTNRTYPENGLEVRFPPAVHDTMIDAVADSLGPFRRARELRAERLGVDSLRPWDLNVSIADAPAPDIPYDEAIDHVVSALAPLGGEYQQRAREFLDGRRVDVYECADKRSDIPAFCPSSTDDGAFVLLNYQRGVRTMFFLVHELGHALHVDYNRDGPAMYATGPRPIEEIPSVLHEMLLAEHCLEEGGPLAAHARNRLLECLAGNFYGGAMQAAFKRELASTVEDGESPSADRIGETYADVRAEFDPVVEQTDYTRYEWLTGALYREAFHHYQYTLGVTGALSVRESLRSGALGPERYRAFLRSTGREEPLALFERLGLDLTTTAPYERAATIFEQHLDRWAQP